MNRKQRRTRTEKRRSARLGALVFILAGTAALAGTISTGSCAQESMRKGNVLSWVTGDQGYGRQRLTTCGVVRMLTPEAVDVVPCQVWNLMPLTGIAAIAAVWLALDLLGLERRRSN